MTSHHPLQMVLSLPSMVRQVGSYQHGIITSMSTGRSAMRKSNTRNLVSMSVRTNTDHRMFQTPLSSLPPSSTTAALPSKASSRPRTFTSLNQSTPYNICFLRHGQSTWNRDNRFIGWTDTPLTDQGVLEARVAGQMLHSSHIQFDEVHTSLLRRSIRTTNVVLMEMAQEYIPVYKHWRLNERNYGALTGLNKKECVAQHGVEQVKRWRRSYDQPPPPMPDTHSYNPIHDPRYRHMLHKIPKSESLHCTLQRSRVYWENVLAPALRDGKTILVVGHENNLRSLIMNLENIPPQDVIHLSLPRAVPLAYQIDTTTLCPINPRTDGSLDRATGFLRGEWLGGDDSVTEILKRDHQQVYDTSITTNLEIGSSTSQNPANGTAWMKVADGLVEIPPGAKALGNETAGSFLGTAPVTASSIHDPICQYNGGQLQPPPSSLLKTPPLNVANGSTSKTTTTSSSSSSVSHLSQSPNSTSNQQQQQRAAA